MSGWTEKNIAPQTAAELHPSDGPCGDCGNPDYAIWSAESRTWNFIMGGPGRRDDPGGFLCPSCFDRRWRDARALGAGSTRP